MRLFVTAWTRSLEGPTLAEQLATALNGQREAFGLKMRVEYDVLSEVRACERLTHDHDVELEALLHGLPPHLLQDGVDAHVAEVAAVALVSLALRGWMVRLC